MSGGESVDIKFGYESTFKTPATADKVFGVGTTIRNVDLKNNIRRLFGIGNRNATDFVAGRFEGALSIEFDISDPWFLKGVMGDISSSGSSPYCHSFIEANKPPSLTIRNGIGVGGVGSGYVRTYLGCIIGDCRITSAVGDEPARATLTILYADETLTSGLISSSTGIDDVYPFSYGSFEYPTGTTIANTESVEFSITNTGALKWGLGDRKPTRFDMRQREYNITTVNYFDDASTYLANAYATSGTPATKMISGQSGLTIKLDNGEVSSQMKKWLFTLGHCIIDHHGLPQSIENELMETVDIQSTNGLIQVTNNTATMP